VRLITKRSFEDELASMKKVSNIEFLIFFFLRTSKTMLAKWFVPY
jgi:hypothetical protein